MEMSHELGEDPEVWRILLEKSGSERAKSCLELGRVVHSHYFWQ